MKTGIGQPVRRREDFRLLTGKGRYSDDFGFPEQTFAVMVRSPYAHARIRSIDTRAAEAAPGVLAVLTGRDMLEDGLQAIRIRWAPAIRPTSRSKTRTALGRSFRRTSR